MAKPRAPNAREVLRTNVIIGRAKARFSQDDLAQRAGVSRQTISRIERAEADVGVDVVDSIANALGVPIAELFIPAKPGVVDDDDLARRASASADEFVDARQLFGAIDQANGLDRYSRAGRPVGR